MEQKQNLSEIVFYARGGQGAKSAAEIMAQAALSEGKFVQAFPSFGPERSGAPVETYLRISNKKIRTREPITKPNVLVILDETLLQSEKKVADVVIVNSAKSEDEIRKKMGSVGKLYLIDANEISLKLIGVARPNSVILGKIAQVAKSAKIESIVREFRKLFEGKIGKEATEKNIAAIQAAYVS
jgi:pyruvate ferredoxin oxidoreductase gamma subunit